LAENDPVNLARKELIILGERDGVPAHTIEQALEGLGAGIVYSSTQCFV